ncbi:response regulator [Candidatus Bathyarchaeota archaeon]|nr:MAG: response regulator [Candidatus Bathyarchaeota archaeon]TMI32452.1 MAG: response regulator [Candidatus Bathyarchaeota archaeon]
MRNTSRSTSEELLLAEDSETDTELTLRALKTINLAQKVHAVKDGKEALEYVFGKEFEGERIRRRVPKVIMLDLKMPKVGGIEVLRRLKSDQRTKDIPVVVLTSSREDSDLKQCYELGVNSYIVKPFGLEEFVKAVATAGLYWMVVNQPPQN